MTSKQKEALDKTRFIRAIGPKGLKPVELWFLSLYFDKSSRITFLNPTESVREMFPDKPTSYCAATGSRFRSRLSSHIDRWLEEDGLSEIRLKEKMYRLLNVEQTKFQKVKGEIDKDKLPPGVRVITAGESNGKYGVECETVIAIDYENPELQARILEDLIKMKGMNAPTQIEVGGIDEFVQRLNDARNKAMRYREDPIEATFTEREETVNNEQDLLDFMQ